MAAQLIQALYNIVDSFFIGRCSEEGLPELGITGAAISTVIGQIVAALIVIRTVFLFGPLGWLFARFGLYYFWLTYPITEIITSAVGFAMFSRFDKNT